MRISAGASRANGPGTGPAQKGKEPIMSYRSSIFVTTTNNGFERMCALGNSIASDCKFLGDGEEPHWVDETAEGTVFGWNWVKWYDSFDEVKHFDEILETTEAEGIPWQFVRIGESDEDVETRYSQANGTADEDLRWVSITAVW